MILEIIENIPIFEGLSKKGYKLISSILHLREYGKGELIFNEGEAGNGMYIIQKGKVKVYSKNKNDEEMIYAILFDHDFFGEVSLVDQGPRSATAIAEEDSILFGFFKPDLLTLIEKNPKIGTKILLNLSSFMGLRLRETNRKLAFYQEKQSENENESPIH